MMEVCGKFVGVIGRLFRIFGFGRQITEAILVVLRYLLFFDFLLSDNSVEWIEFKNLSKPGVIQIFLDFLDLNLDLNLEMVRQLFGGRGWLIYSRLFVSRDPRWWQGFGLPVRDSTPLRVGCSECK